MNHDERRSKRSLPGKKSEKVISLIKDEMSREKLQQLEQKHMLLNYKAMIVKQKTQSLKRLKE